jgi:hypothetical protein
MTDAMDPVRLAVRRRQPESLEELGELMSKQPHVQSMDLNEIENTIVQHRRATEQSTYQDDMRPSRILEERDPNIRDAEVPARDALTDIAIMLASLPLRMAMEMAEAVVTLPEFKAPENKIQLAMLLNEWAEKRLAAQYADR